MRLLMCWEHFKFCLLTVGNKVGARTACLLWSWQWSRAQVGCCPSLLLCGGLTHAGFTSPCGSSGPRVAVRKQFSALRECCRCACLSRSPSGRLLSCEHTGRSGCSWTVLPERALHAAAGSEPLVMVLIWRSWGSVDTAFCSVGHQWAFWWSVFRANSSSGPRLGAALKTSGKEFRQVALVFQTLVCDL